jgi:hypothetical protein
MWVMNMNSAIVFVLSVIAFAAFLRSLVVAVFRYRLHREALRAEIQLRHKVIERLESPDEFRSFLELHPLTAVVAPDAEDAYRRIVRSTVTGSVLMLVAIACGGVMILTRYVGSPWMGSPLLLTFGGIITATAGAAFLAAAGISYRMLRGWNLLPPTNRPSTAVL